MRADSTISSIDILRFVKSRYALDITHPEAVDVVRGLGGGVPCAEVVSSAVIKRNQQRKKSSPRKKKRELWTGALEQEGEESESEIKLEISDLPIVEYLDLVQIMSILMIPTFVKVGRRWSQSNQESYVEVEDPNFTPIPGNLLLDYIAGLAFGREDKSLIPPENLISDVLRGFWRDMGHKGLHLENLLKESLAYDESNQDGIDSTSASQKMGLSMAFEADSTRCFRHDVESKQQEYDTTGEVHNVASAQEEATNAVASETDTAVSQQHYKVDEGDDRVGALSSQNSDLGEESIPQEIRDVAASMETSLQALANESLPPPPEGKADISMGRTMESSRRCTHWHNQEGISTKRDPVGIDRTATLDEKKLEATYDGADVRAGNDELECPPKKCTVDNPSFTSRKQGNPRSNGLDISLPGMTYLPPKLTPGLVKALFLANGEPERAKDTVLIHRMIEAAQSSSGRFDDEALINAITSDLGAWGVEFEDRNTTYIYDSLGAEEAYSFQQSGLSQQYQKPTDSVKKDGSGNGQIIKRTALEPIDSVIDSFASTFTVVIIWIFYLCLSGIHIALGSTTNSTEIDCGALGSFWCTLINTIFRWYEYTHSIIIRLCRLFSNLYLSIA